MSLWDNFDLLSHYDLFLLTRYFFIIGLWFDGWIVCSLTYLLCRVRGHLYHLRIYLVLMVSFFRFLLFFIVILSLVACFELILEILISIYPFYLTLYSFSTYPHSSMELACSETSSEIENHKGRIEFLLFFFMSYYCTY